MISWFLYGSRAVTRNLASWRQSRAAGSAVIMQHATLASSRTII